MAPADEVTQVMRVVPSPRKKLSMYPVYVALSIAGGFYLGSVVFRSSLEAWLRKA